MNGNLLNSIKHRKEEIMILVSLGTLQVKVDMGKTNLTHWDENGKVTSL
jgi:hypothetical protein